MSDIETYTIRELSDLVDDNSGLVLAILDLKNATEIPTITEAYNRVISEAMKIAEDRFIEAVRVMKYKAISEGHDLRISAQGGIT